MYLIDLVYRTILTIANSDIRGNVKPSDARLLINTTVEEIYESYFYELNRMQNRANKGLIENGSAHLPDRLREKIQHYNTSADIKVIDKGFVLPSDLRYIESVFVDNNEVELVKNASQFHTIKTTTSKQYPIGFKDNQNNISIYPLGFKEASVYYLRKPKLANWTYVVVNGSEIFNPSASDFQDIDIHQSEVSNVILKTLQKVGINLKEQDLQQVMQQQQNIEFNQEIQS